MPEVPPPMRVASSTVTAAPAGASRYATEAPITPAPITIVLIICIASGSKWIMACDHPATGIGHQDRLDGPAFWQRRSRILRRPRLSYWRSTPLCPNLGGDRIGGAVMTNSSPRLLIKNGH